MDRKRKLSPFAKSLKKITSLNICGFDVKLTFKPEEGEYGGGFSPCGRIINIDPSILELEDNDIMWILTHEINHAIWWLGGFTQMKLGAHVEEIVVDCFARQNLLVLRQLLQPQKKHK